MSWVATSGDLGGRRVRERSGGRRAELFGTSVDFADAVSKITLANYVGDFVLDASAVGLLAFLVVAERSCRDNRGQSQSEEDLVHDGLRCWSKGNSLDRLCKLD